jgi:hypothetical protein
MNRKIKYSGSFRMLHLYHGSLCCMPRKQSLFTLFIDRLHQPRPRAFAAGGSYFAG